MASYKINVLKLEGMYNAITISLYDLYFKFLKGNNSFPYLEVDRLLNRYELLYCKTFSGNALQKFLRGVSRKELDNDIARLSKDKIMKNVCRRVLGEVYFDALKYVPKNEEEKDRISDKLFPILKNFSPFEIADIYMKFKRSAGLRGVLIDDNSLVMLQQIFVSSIISVLSHNSDDKYSTVRSLWTYEDVCRDILKEPVLSLESVNKRVR